MTAYRTRQQRVAIAGVEDLQVRLLFDRNQYEDDDGSAERIGISSASWPLFGLLWPSGAQLAARLAARPVDAAERILEIGCGLGLASLVAHRRGADVTASDCHPLAETFLLENVRLNGLRPLPYLHGDWADVADAKGLGIDAVVRGRYDLVVGSDLLYERDDGGVLAGFIGRHAGATAEVWIVDPDRGNRPAFNRRMAAEGFACGEARLDRAASADGAAYKGRLLRYRRVDGRPCDAAGATSP